MKRVLSLMALAALTLILVFCAHASVVQIHAQSLPAAKTLTWTASVVDATHSAPDNYVVKLDGTTIGSPTGTSQTVTFTTAGPHTLTVAGVNVWGSSPVATLNVNVSVPNAPAGLQIN